MADTFSNILLHIIFSTKYRKPMIDLEIQDRLYSYMGGFVRNYNGVLYVIGGMEDHVHLLVRWNTDAIKNLVRDMKSESTKWVRKSFDHHHEFQWQSGGGIFSVSQSQKKAVENYIRNQAKHHQRWTFKEEYLEFLLKNEVEFDERYVFD